MRLPSGSTAASVEFPQSIGTSAIGVGLGSGLGLAWGLGLTCGLGLGCGGTRLA